MYCPDYVKNCIDLLEKARFSAYAVGGAVRDSLLGVAPADWDVTTSALPDDILNVFSDFRTIPTGIKHGTVTVLFEIDEGTAPIEITTYRIDGEYRDSRHPENVSFSSNLFDDLSRRDFTVNAMAYNEKDGIIDVFGGRQDLEDHIIRTVGDPEKRFSEDALRILRAFRFSAQLSFEIEEKTLLGAYSCAYLLKNIARERVGAEFKRLIASTGLEYSLSKMIEGGVWRAAFDTEAPSSELISKVAAVESRDFLTRVAILIAEHTEEERVAFLDSLRLSNNEKKTALRLCSVRNFGALADFEELSVLARRFLHLYENVCDEAIYILRAFSDAADHNAFVRAIEIEKRAKRPLQIKDLAVKGSDILPLCKNDHARVGFLLSRLLMLVIENPELNDKEKLIEIAKKES